MQPGLWIVLGVVAGTLGGLFGVGGGLVMIPAMVYLCGLTQHQAQGTSLAVMLPPIGLLAVWRYYVAGHVQMAMAAYVCAGFLLGGLLGANIANALSELWLRRAFAVFLVAVATEMLMRR